MPIMRLCPRCAAIIEPGRKLCVDCQRADDRRRNEKRKTSSRSSVSRQRLSLAALHRDNFTCQRCGKVGDRRQLTGHLDPRLGGNHRIAALEDITTLCLSCHGSADAPRSHAQPEKVVTRRVERDGEGVSVG